MNETCKIANYRYYIGFGAVGYWIK